MAGALRKLQEGASVQEVERAHGWVVLPGTCQESCRRRVQGWSGARAAELWAAVTEGGGRMAWQERLDREASTQCLLARRWIILQNP
jgi:hypothetical protein